MFASQVNPETKVMSSTIEPVPISSTKETMKPKLIRMFQPSHLKSFYFVAYHCVKLNLHLG